ncbi:hypothetical protein SDC9_196333 [bioreactor metagenome]|uniref:Uncharacterized protein n=1 Tax=bioreactor metagenome TaxID=1076179 RepID=A0A645IBJ6_9ZZZZ
MQWRRKGAWPEQAPGPGPGSSAWAYGVTSLSTRKQALSAEGSVKDLHGEGSACRQNQHDREGSVRRERICMAGRAQNRSRWNGCGRALLRYCMRELQTGTAPRTIQSYYTPATTSATANGTGTVDVEIPGHFGL